MINFYLQRKKCWSEVNDVVLWKYTNPKVCYIWHSWIQPRTFCLKLLVWALNKLLQYHKTVCCIFAVTCLSYDLSNFNMLLRKIRSNKTQTLKNRLRNGRLGLSVVKINKLCFTKTLDAALPNQNCHKHYLSFCFVLHSLDHMYNADIYLYNVYMYDSVNVWHKQPTTKRIQMLQ